MGYSRAIRKYYKKFGRYPARIEELENTTQLRFLRKRYQDPITRKDFKLIRQGDPALNMLGLGGIGQGLGQAAGQGNKPGFVGATGGGVRAAGPGDSNTPQVTGLPQPQNAGAPNPAGGDSVNPGAQVDAQSASSSSSSSDSTPAPGGQVFGGGPILGVASISKASTIREFNRKNHYNDWLFIYDPSSDRGGLLNAPVQPDLNKGLGAASQPGTAQPAANAGPGQGGQQPGPPPTQEPPED